MKTDKAQLKQAIEAIKIKLAVIEEELNKPDEYRHFPSKGDEYHYYISTGTLCTNIATEDCLRVEVFKTRNEAYKAYTKAVALEKVKRRLLELQGDWKPDWTECSEEKLGIQYDHNKKSFIPVCWFTAQFDSLIPFMEDEQTALTIINEFNNELNLVFEIK